MARIGKPLGVAYVRIRGDSKKLKGDLDTAKSQVIAAGKRMALGIGVVGLAVAGIGFAIKNLSKEWIRLANEQEAVEKRLSAVVKASGNAAGLSAKQMIDMAGAMQKVTTVGDETIIAGQAILATFKNIRGEGFERTTMAALDMSEVMQQDLRSSIVMLGKALNDPIANLSALSRAGVQFTKDQKDMVSEMWKAGDVAGAQAIILKELESQFGGAAKAAKNTFGGAMKSLDNTIGDFKEELGFAITKNEVFIRAIKELEQSIIDLGPDVKAVVDQFSKWVEANEQFIRQKIPEYIGRIKDGLERIWKIASYDSDILTYGLVGLVLGGKKWAVVMGGMAHMVNWAQNLAGAFENVKNGLVDFSEIASANFKELEELANRSKVFTGTIPPYITITPGAVKRGGGDITPGDSDKTKSLQSTLGITGAERGHMASAQMAADSAKFVKIAKAQYDGLMVGATDSFMGMAAANERATEMMKDDAKSTSDFMKDAFTGWASSYSSTLTDMLWESELTFDGILESFGRMLTQMVIQKGMVAGIDALFPALAVGAHGMVVSGPGISAYSGQVVDRPTVFPFARGVGLMGESGAEAILPLSRTTSGDLGVKSFGSQNIKIEMINKTGQDMQASSPEVKFDADSMILSVVLDGFSRNKMGLRDAMKGLR